MKTRKIEYLKLPPQFKSDWLEALRGGEYEQGKEQLLDDTGKYCCLGVACAMIDDGEFLEQDGNQEFILAVDEPSAEIPDCLIGEGILPTRLANMNDGVGYKKRQSFKQIANWIERNL